MKKLSIIFVALAIVFAAASAFTPNHKVSTQNYIHWFAIVDPYGSLLDISTYDISALADPPQACSTQGARVCAAKISHCFDVDALDQSDLTEGAFLDLRYKD